MDLSQGTNQDEGASARTSSSRSGEAGQDDKEVQQKQRAGSGDEEEDDGGGDDEGTRQPYKCTFCRRGFPTAQALGGHMNVHRRHRGRSAAATAAAAQGSSSSCYEHPTTAAAVVAFGQAHPAAHRAERQRPYELRLFGRDCAAGGRRGSKEGGGSGDVRRDRCGYARDGDGGDHGGGGGEELDLELRLGGAGP